VPLPPGRPSVVAVDGHRATIEWTPPAVDPKCPPLAGYQVMLKVEYRVYGTVDWMVANDALTPECTYTVENLRPNGVYEFRVRGRNADGLGTPSRSSGATHIKPAAPQRGVGSRPVLPGLRPPGQPQLVEADMDWVKMEWAASEDGAGYIVEFREVGDPNWYTANPHPITVNCIHVGDLIVGHEYQFRVLAHNVVGCSEPSEASPPVKIHASAIGEAKYVEAERFGAVKLLMEEMVRESPPLPERDDSPPPLRHGKGNGNLQWRDPSLKEVIDYLDNPDREKQLNASGYLQHLTFSDNLIKDET
ncbi:fibronectin type III domain protein, partial [Teladorsagia circumcincta]